MKKTKEVKEKVQKEAKIVVSKEQIDEALRNLGALYSTTTQAFMKKADHDAMIKIANQIQETLLACKE